jgi:inosose dehydratase
VKESGFDAVMLEVLAQQTLQRYAAIIEDLGLRLAPGYVQVTLPEDEGLDVARGSADWIRRLDQVRRRAEESAYFGLDTVFLSSDMRRGRPRTAEHAAVGHAADPGRLERVIELLSDAADTLREEGIRPAFHNHVGTWVETREEIDAVMAAIDPSVLSAGFDIGHLVWAGIDPVEMISAYRGRIAGIHIKDIDVSLADRARSEAWSYYDAIDAGIIQEPGRGSVDLDGVLAALGDDFDGWVIVEVDRPTMDPLESARVSADWVRHTITV